MPFSAVPRRRATLPAACAVLLLLVAGCASDPDVLVRVGSRTVTVDEFMSVARGNEFQYPGAPDSAKAALLEDLTRRLLLLAEAEDRGLFRDTLTLNVRRAAEERVLMQALYERMAPAAGVSDAEVAEFAAWRDSSARMQLIYVSTRPAAEAALAALAAGEPFGSVADRFNTAGLLPPGGDLGPLLPGSLVAPLDRLLRTAPLGRVVGPVEAPGEGWFLVRVSERRPNERPNGPEPEAVLRDMILQRKQRLARINATLRLREAWRYRIAPDGAQILFQRFNPAFDPTTGQLGSPPPLTPEEARRVLATWDGGAYTLADAYADLDRPEDRPNPSMIAALEAWIDAACTRRIAIAEARRRLLHEEPAIRERIQRTVDNYVLDAIYRSDVLAEAQLDSAWLRDYFERHRDDFQRLDAVEIESVTLRDTAQVSAVLRHAASAPSLAEALAAAGVSAAAETRTVTFPTTDPTLGFLERSFMQTPAGGVVGPQMTADGLVIMRVVSKQQTPQDFEELSGEALMLLQAQAQEARRDEAFRRVTDHLRRLHPPVLRPERLRRIPWPIPAAGAAPAGAAS
uniref:PpiC domain-containing protein n=1 Tax=Eiseniibacteriota bacterium TaxID=2212470 RepID=A0A832I1V6_UNCEI